jgi:hypothetical protein
MSNPHSTTPSATAPGSANEDGMNIAKIIIVGVVSLVIFAVSAVIAGVIISMDEGQLKVRGMAPLPADIQKKEEIGIIDYVEFDRDTRLEVWRKDMAKKLSSYGWVDRQKGIIHIPIEQAMKDVIQQAGGGSSK